MAFRLTLTRGKATLALLAVATLLGGCASGPRLRPMTAHECMTRVMYFESNRSSEEGMIAVGTVVMNRLESGRYPKTVCGVVGQKNQFAPGVLTRPMEKGKDLASRTATKVLKGARHRHVEKAMFFHTAGMTFPYTNMHYLIEAGGNVFYEKRKNARRLNDPPFRNPEPYDPRRPAAQSSGMVAATARSASPAPVRGSTSASLEPISIDDLIRSNRY
ncbi:cell wall hydrolase [Aurantimonas sp. A2-1-M11]|uniref:cell wall hydrolase n=1 Tax=Aurantimonas sp. A2-1-M11 TaxID=3113712 RepID=UPI003FA596EB